MEELVREVEVSIQSLQGNGIPYLKAFSGSSLEYAEIVQQRRRELHDLIDLVQRLEIQVSQLPPKELPAGNDFVVDVKTRLASLETQIRAVTLATKKRIDAKAAADERRLLFQTQSKAKPTTASTNDDALMSATSEVTNRLQQAISLMQQELDRSLLSSQMLSQSTSTLRLTSEEHSTLSGLLTASKGLISDLERADLLDRCILISGLLIFFICCAYVFHKRVVRKTIYPFISTEAVSKTLTSIISPSPTVISLTSTVASLTSMLSVPTQILTSIHNSESLVTSSTYTPLSETMSEESIHTEHESEHVRHEEL